MHATTSVHPTRSNRHRHREPRDKSGAETLPVIAQSGLPDRVCFFPDINNAAENARRANTNLVVRATGAAAMVMEAEAILSVLLTGVLGYERRLATAVPCVVMGPSTLQT